MPLSAFMFMKVPGTSWVSPLSPRTPRTLESPSSCLAPCPPGAFLVLSHPLLSPAGNLKSSVTFDLTLDPGRLSPRAIFKETRARNLTRTLDLGLSQHCEEVALLLSVRRLGGPGSAGVAETGSDWAGTDWGVFWSWLWLSPSVAPGMQELLHLCQPKE